MPDPYWKADFQEAVLGIIARQIEDPQRESPVWDLMEEYPDTSHDLQELFQRFDAAGFHLEESSILQELLCRDETITPALVYNILPQLQDTRDRFRTLEVAVDLNSRRFSGFVNDMSEALPVHHGNRWVPPVERQLYRLGAISQRYKDTKCYDDDEGTLQPASKSGGTSECLDADDRYKVLTERIQALEDMVKEHENQMNLQQTITVAEEPSAASTQELRRAMQAHQPTFAALSDASESSTYAPTPASIVVDESTDQTTDMGQEETPSTPLSLRIKVHTDDDGHHRLNRPGSTHSMIVRMYPNTPFKVLTDKLRERWSNRELMLSGHAMEYVFDSDTPASFKLEQDDSLEFARVYFGAELLDLTI